ncbi:MAG: N-terminal phage integrase SAM-like domain-containing protein [Actinomycetota bacterium]|nr:N-terminal phage integrase SAM-like domain-containing protein [Actinomycetota bacterium]
MTRRKQALKDLTGIRQRGNTYQVRISGGCDPVTGRQLFLTGSADTQDAAIVLRDRLRQQVKDNTAAKTNVTLGYLLHEWSASHQVEETTRATYQLLIDSFIRPALGDTPISLWVPNRSSTSCDLGVFVDQSAEPIASSEVKQGW